MLFRLVRRRSTTDAGAAGCCARDGVRATRPVAGACASMTVSRVTSGPVGLPGRCHNDSRDVLDSRDCREEDREKKRPPRLDALRWVGVPAGGASGAGLHLQPFQPKADRRSTSRFRACTADMPS